MADPAKEFEETMVRGRFATLAETAMLDEGLAAPHVARIMREVANLLESRDKRE